MSKMRCIWEELIYGDIWEEPIAEPLKLIKIEVNLQPHPSITNL